MPLGPSVISRSAGSPTATWLISACTLVIGCPWTGEAMKNASGSAVPEHDKRAESRTAMAAFLIVFIRQAVAAVSYKARDLKARFLVVCKCLCLVDRRRWWQEADRL